MTVTFSTFDRLPKTVEAFEWTPEIEYEDVVILKPRLVRSEDGNMYFIEHVEKDSMCWLSNKIPGAVPKHKRKEKPHGWVQFRNSDGSDMYHRKVLPFAFFPDIQVGKDEEVVEGSPELIDFAYANQWQDANLDVTTGILKSMGQVFKVQSGDYIIRDGDKVHALPAAMFIANYEEV